MPEPVHSLWMALVSTHDAPQGVPAAQYWQDPLPSHTPVKPHDMAGEAGQSATLRGIAPVGMGSQKPSSPWFLRAAEHAWQGSVHALSQQTPSTQKPLGHSMAVVQLAPSGRTVYTYATPTNPPQG